MSKNIIEKIKEKKKKIIKVVLVFTISAVTVGILGTTIVYNKIKSNINYTKKQAIEIALEQIPGEVAGVRYDLELERLSLEYDIKIKDKNNILREVTVDSKLGAIVDFEDYMYND